MSKQTIIGGIYGFCASYGMLLLGIFLFGWSAPWEAPESPYHGGGHEFFVLMGTLVGALSAGIREQLDD